MNPLEDYPKARRIAYQIFWTVSLLVGAAHIGFQSVGDVPAWLTTTLAVLPFVGAGIGYTASQNTTTARHAKPQDPTGYHSGV